MTDQRTRDGSAPASERDWARGPITRTGLELRIRPAEPGDLDRLRDFFRHVSPEDLRHRFLSALREVSADRLEAMTRKNDPRVIDFLAIEPASGEVIATAMLVADEAFDTAEFAICTRADSKHQGVSWTILEHLIRFAEAAGIKRLESLQTADDSVAMQLEREMGFAVRRCPDDATLMIAEKTLG